MDSSAPDSMAALTDAVAAIGATIAFDAVGGGDMANTILTAMESAINRRATGYSRYGSATHKQIYIHGGLDPNLTMTDRGFGLYFGIDGFMLGTFLQKIGDDRARLQARIVAELETTFASHFKAEISLAEALSPEIAIAYARRATGEQYLINPAKGL